MPKGSASRETDEFKTQSTFSANGLLMFPKIPTILACLLLKTGSKNTNSGVVPLFDK